MKQPLKGLVALGCWLLAGLLLYGISRANGVQPWDVIVGGLGTTFVAECVRYQAIDDLQPYLDRSIPRSDCRTRTGALAFFFCGLAVFIGHLCTRLSVD